MSPALVLAFASAIAWASLDALRKHLATMGAVPLVVLMSLGQAPLFATWWALEGGAFDPGTYLIPAAASLVLNVAANLLFVRAVQLSPLSVTVPLLSLTPALTVAIANPLLGEHPSIEQLVGVTAVVGGALLLRPARSTPDGPGGLRALLAEPGVPRMVGVAVLWSATSALDKLATRHTGVPIHALAMNGGVGLVLLSYLAFAGRLRELRAAREHAGPLLAAVAAASIAFGAQLMAFQALLVGLVETIKRGVGLTSAVVVGRVWFGEPLTAGNVVGALVMAAGTALIALTA